jgi:hypothetical protein
MINDKVILRLSEVLESVNFGVMEWWRIGKKDINSLAITPTTHCSNTLKLIEI